MMLYLEKQSREIVRDTYDTYACGRYLQHIMYGISRLRTLPGRLVDVCPLSVPRSMGSNWGLYS
jgi:hypothetical protein